MSQQKVWTYGCGKITDAAIREYQRKHGLEVDGKVGPKTRQCMRQ